MHEILAYPNWEEYDLEYCELIGNSFVNNDFPDPSLMKNVDPLGVGGEFEDNRYNEVSPSRPAESLFEHLNHAERQTG